EQPAATYNLQEPPAAKIDETESLLLDFQNCDLRGKCKAVAAQAKLAGYDLTKYLAMWKERGRDGLEALEACTLEGLFEHLLSLRKPSPVADDDVPFAM
ncbi:MAG: hypothetical protein Q8P24_02030, partial [Desulfobacterales bacterium]|nr:hypothetical protein [Desulfobacterales bacterium]